MKPKDKEFELSELLDGSLEGDQAEALRRRLAEDPALAAEYGRYASLDAILDQMADEDMPDVDWELQRQSIRAAMERDALLAPPRRVWPRRLFRIGGAVATAAAAVVLVVVGLQWFGPGARPLPSEWDVAWRRPMSPTGGMVEAAAIAPRSAPAGELEVAYSEQAGPGAPGVHALSALDAVAAPGTIVISAGPRPSRASQGGGWSLDEL